MTDTIVAISTPAAPAGLGVVRLSGPEAVVVAERVFRPCDSARALSRLAGYSAAYGHVGDGEGDIDDCVALLFRAPHSYTGEDVVELSCHGGLYLLQRVLRACVEAGARPATAGEFTRRAFVNGKMDLTQAESVMDLIAADGRLAAKTALAAREGATYRRLQQVKESLLAVAAQFGAYIDYPDEDIPELQPAALEQTVTEAATAVTALLATFDAGRVLREGIDTAIVGSPNVGKSTLMNCLAGCERSIVTDIAGTTRDVVEETVRLGDVLLRLADTAGIRDTADAVETVGVEKARRRLEQAALVLAVFDGSRPLSDEDKALVQQVASTTAIAIINKADKPLQIEKEWLESHFERVVTLSAKEEDGIDALIAAVAQVTGVEGLDAAQPLLTTERQRLCAQQCLACLEEAQTALQSGMTLDAVSVSLDGAIAALLELTGERTTEAVVEQVFARFCVGK
ncbi:MAG: tRNA uridine-5-carboxymethylaminomethyl(34) synthesis GTPase MnmE [Clostridia bacterium]|nr:tRNA uridine-5-carboxymethylaminomethyl(34) synthesis GTPase MnmE [Clostridia bacterium]